MKKGVAFCLMLLANPAFAHHEVVVATSMIPLISASIAIPVAVLAAWRRARRKSRSS